MAQISHEVIIHRLFLSHLAAIALPKAITKDHDYWEAGRQKCNGHNWHSVAILVQEKPNTDKNHGTCPNVQTGD
jgi:hypothetical protein